MRYLVKAGRGRLVDMVKVPKGATVHRTSAGLVIHHRGRVGVAFRGYSEVNASSDRALENRLLRKKGLQRVHHRRRVGGNPFGFGRMF
jgi:hypothetical protein